MNARSLRRSKETKVEAKVWLRGSGKSDVRTGVKFLDHMLDSFSTHSLVDISIRAEGDLQHHVVEDVSLTLGGAINRALGDRSGIRRFGYSIVPMDDALVVAAVDLVKRPYSSVDLRLSRPMLEDAPREDLEHFFSSLAASLQATVHIRVLDGRNDHHKFEAAVKAFAFAFRDAVERDPRRGKLLPTSKGTM